MTDKPEDKTGVMCDCDDWAKGAHQVFNAQVQYTLATGEKYTGSIWAFCPWCGKKLANRDAGLCVKCGKRERYKKNGRTFRLCAVCGWENLENFLNSMDEDEQKQKDGPNG